MVTKSKTEKPAAKKRGPNGGARPGSGRKPFSPTDAERKQAEALSGYGVPIDQIAVLIRGGIDTDTLRKHFSQELISGKAKANGKVGQTLFQKVMSGDTTAMIWWSKTQMRWSELPPPDPVAASAPSDNAADQTQRDTDLVLHVLRRAAQNGPHATRVQAAAKLAEILGIDRREGSDDDGQAIIDAFRGFAEQAPA